MEENIQEVSTNQTENKKVNNQPKFLFILLGLVFALLLLGGGYYLGQQKATTTTTTTPTQALTTPTPTIDPITTWKTYTNTKYGYSLKYPNDKFIRYNCPGEELILAIRPQNENSEVINPESCGRDALFPVEVRTVANTVKIPVSDKNYELVTKSLEFQNITGKKYIKTYIGTESENNFPFMKWLLEIHINHNDKVHIVYSSNQELEPVIDQILSTFKFTDPSTTSLNECPPEYELFENEYFSICYPKNAEAKTTTIDDPAIDNWVNVTFTTKTDVLSVTNNFIGGWGPDPCVTQEKIVLKDYQATRVTENLKLDDGKCSDVRSYTTTIKAVNKNTIYGISLINIDSQKATTLTEQQYSLIENSLKIK